MSLLGSRTRVHTQNYRNILWIIQNKVGRCHMSRPLLTQKILLGECQSKLNFILFVWLPLIELGFMTLSMCGPFTGFKQKWYLVRDWQRYFECGLRIHIFGHELYISRVFSTSELENNDGMTYDPETTWLWLSWCWTRKLHAKLSENFFGILINRYAPPPNRAIINDNRNAWRM